MFSNAASGIVLEENLLLTKVPIVKPQIDGRGQVTIGFLIKTGEGVGTSH